MKFEIDQLREKVRAGERIESDEAFFIHSQFSLADLGCLAQLVRNKFNPSDRATYLIDRNINYTNVCNTDCSFCGFYRPNSRHPESYVLTKDVLEEKIEEAIAHGATRILLQGGHNDDLSYDYYLDLVSWIHEKFPIEINAFSPSEIAQIAKVSQKPSLEVLKELQSVGLSGLPGGGAEILDDDIRKLVSPKKISSAMWISIMEQAHLTGLTTTATMVIGLGESLEQRLNHFEKLRASQDLAMSKGLAGFNAFISWPLQHSVDTSLGRSKRASQLGAGGVDYLRNAALARIYLDNIPHHQASWPTLGAELASVALHMGCDDFGSTMMEENVVSKAGALSAEKYSMTVGELQHFIRRAGFRPAQRNSAFDIIREWDV